ncbi:MAG: hydrogenase maturation protease [Actinomycetota bacterium]|nr:hydrogenase maturation protease [Actinomycetota bacterium]
MSATPRIIVACVGNVLRRDDGFGYAVAERLTGLPDGTEVLETGIGGIALLQELMRGCDGLIVVDAVARDAAPGTLFEIEPEIGEPSAVPDMHLANPDQVLAMARRMDCLPERVLLVGCQPLDADGLGQGLTPPVARAVDVAAERIRATVMRWTNAT